MWVKQPKTLLIKVHNLNCHLNWENTVTSKDYIKNNQTKLPNQSFSNMSKTFSYVNLDKQ